MPEINIPMSRGRWKEEPISHSVARRSLVTSIYGKQVFPRPTARPSPPAREVQEQQAVFWFSHNDGDAGREVVAATRRAAIS